MTTYILPLPLAMGLRKNFLSVDTLIIVITCIIVTLKLASYVMVSIHTIKIILKGHSRKVFNFFLFHGVVKNVIDNWLQCTDIW